MKRIFFAFLLISFIYSAVTAQDDECYACNNENDNSYYYDEEWIQWQEQLIREGYGTIFDTDAYRNGNYYVGEDGRTYLVVSADPEEEPYERDYEYYHDYSRKGTSATKSNTTKSKITWTCVDVTSYDGNAYNDNKCTSSTGQVLYVKDSEAKKLDPKYKPGKSGAWYYNNK